MCGICSYILQFPAFLGERLGHFCTLVEEVCATVAFCKSLAQAERKTHKLNVFCLKQNGGVLFCCAGEMLICAYSDDSSSQSTQDRQRDFIWFHVGLLQKSTCNSVLLPFIENKDRFLVYLHSLYRELEGEFRARETSAGQHVAIGDLAKRFSEPCPCLAVHCQIGSMNKASKCVCLNSFLIMTASHTHHKAKAVLGRCQYFLCWRKMLAFFSGLIYTHTATSLFQQIS